MCMHMWGLGVPLDWSAALIIIQFTYVVYKAKDSIALCDDNIIKNNNKTVNNNKIFYESMFRHVYVCVWGPVYPCVCVCVCVCRGGDLVCLTHACINQWPPLACRYMN